MMTDNKQETPYGNRLLGMTARMVSAYVSNNPVPKADLPNVILTVHESLRTLESDGARGRSYTGREVPVVPIKKSVTPNFIVCLEDGRKLKMLKRHLRTAYGLTPDEYRAKWGLPSSYPMVAPNYAKQRSEFAMKIGLGKRPRA
jgi:predicted transcriptional regulator|tara:strand:- start:3495 stop:3926 length:432 start_codon:yes stop_codon:yes gene_type:complete